MPKKQNNILSSPRSTHYSPNFLRTSDGFTFLELMITLGISLILVVVGTVSLLSFRNQQNLENEARALVAILTEARNRAIHEESGSRWGVWVTNPVDTPANYTLFQVNEILFASSTYTDLPGTKVDQKFLKSGLLLSTPASGAVIDVVFTKLTGLPNASTSIVLALAADADSQKTITVSSNGLIDYQ